MRLAIVACLVAVSLAGCATGENNLAKYTVQPGDLSDSFHLVDINDENFTEEFAQMGMTSNPGAGDPGNLPGAKAIYGAVYVHDVSGQIFSSAVQMDSVEEAQMIAEGIADCDNMGDGDFQVLRNSAVLVLVEGEGLPEDGTVEYVAAIQAIMARTGATSPCTGEEASA